MESGSGNAMISFERAVLSNDKQPKKMLDQVELESAKRLYYKAMDLGLTFSSVYVDSLFVNMHADSPSQQVNAVSVSVCPFVTIITLFYWDLSTVYLASDQREELMPGFYPKDDEAFIIAKMLMEEIGSGKL